MRRLAIVLLPITVELLIIGVAGLVLLPNPPPSGRVAGVFQAGSTGVVLASLAAAECIAIRSRDWIGAVLVLSFVYPAAALILLAVLLPLGAYVILVVGLLATAFEARTLRLKPLTHG